MVQGSGQSLVQGSPSMERRKRRAKGDDWFWVKGYLSAEPPLLTV